MARVFTLRYFHNEGIMEDAYREKTAAFADGVWIARNIWTCAEYDAQSGNLLHKTGYEIVPAHAPISNYVLEIHRSEDARLIVEKKKICLASCKPFAIIEHVGNMAQHPDRQQCFFIDMPFDMEKLTVTYARQIEDGIDCREFLVPGPRMLYVGNTISSGRNGRYYRLIDIALHCGRYPAEIWDSYEPFSCGEQILIAPDEQMVCYGECIALKKGTVLNLARHATEEGCHCVLHQKFREKLMHSIWIPEKWGDAIICLEALGYAPKSAAGISKSP